MTDNNLYIAYAILGSMIFVLVSCSVMAVRNWLVYRYRIRAIRECTTRADTARFDRAPSYNRMLWDFRKWTYRQFFGSVR